MTFIKGQMSFNKGKKMSEEQKLKISKACKGRLTWNKGIPHTEKHKNNLSKNHWSKKIGYVSPLKGIIKPYKSHPNCSHPAWNKGLIGFNAGENHYNWRGGITKYSKLLRSSNRWKYWREQVFKRDDFICQDCGIKGKYLHPHHLVPMTECLLLDFEELIFDVDNGLTLCQDCHFSGKYHKNIRRGD